MVVESDKKAPGFAPAKPFITLMRGQPPKGIEEAADEKYYLKFLCSFIQKRLFNNFSGEIFEQMGKLYYPFEDIEDAITENSLNIIIMDNQLIRQLILM